MKSIRCSECTTELEYSRLVYCEEAAKPPQFCPACGSAYDMNPVQAVSQPITVIAPPLEWGEWENKGIGVRMDVKLSKCCRFSISRVGANEFEVNADEDYDHTTESEDKAVEICNTYRQAKVTRALEGCNVIPYCDPQRLVEGIKKQFADFDTARAEGLDALSALSVLSGSIKLIVKAWEDGK